MQTFEYSGITKSLALKVYDVTSIASHFINFKKQFSDKEETANYFIKFTEDSANKL
jgi:hypothetical protein